MNNILKSGQFDCSFYFIKILKLSIEQGNKILEKPKSKEECKAWFKEYSGNKVIAYTYMVIGVIDENKKCIAKRNFLSTTYVNFDILSEECIDDYINTDEPYDKAGGFGIQANAKSLITGIEGDFYNVVGFPVNAFTKNLTSLLEEVYGKNFDFWSSETRY